MTSYRQRDREWCRADDDDAYASLRRCTAERKFATNASKSASLALATAIASSSSNNSNNYTDAADENSCPNVLKPPSMYSNKISMQQVVTNRRAALLQRRDTTAGVRQPPSKSTMSRIDDHRKSTNTVVDARYNTPSKSRLVSSSSVGACVASSSVAAEEEVAAATLHQCKTELRRRLLLQERQQQQHPRRTRLFTEDGMCGTTTNRGNDDVDHVGAQVREMVKRTESMATSSTMSTKTDVVDAPSSASAHSHHPPTLPPSQNHRSNIHRFLNFTSHFILLVLVLFELQDYYGNLYSPLGMVFDFISIMTERGVDMFHVGFVLAFGMRGLICAWDAANQKWRQYCHRTTILSSLQLLMYFLVVASCWLTLLPIFKDCGGSDSSNHSNNSNKFCFFIERRVSKGRFPRRIFHISSPRYSTSELVVKILYKKTKLVLMSKIQGRLMREILLAIIRPLAFRGRLRKLLKVIRYASFFAPLFGTCNKLRGHVLDMFQRRRQHNASMAARKRWIELIDAFSQQSKLERAVRTLQRRYLERREQKAQRRYALMAPQRANSNLKVACKIRRKLMEEEHLSRSRLDRMAILDSQRKMRSQVSIADKTNITHHRESSRKLKRRLLLSPKTSFAVGWKYFAVACVALEISSQIFAPMLSGELKKMPLYEFIVRVLTASSVSKCGDKGKKVAASSIFVPVMIDNSLGDSACLASSWELTAHMLATLLVPMVNAIFFLDVFITFFTGELTSSGTLVAKPIVERYIFPGIGLQLIVNPTMATITQFVKRTIGHATRVGPSLFFHLLLACFPFASYCCDQMLELVFDFVERQNKFISGR
ncbi:hypothetical protein ACHAWU_007086 [Discostella pseudostelligera]|uniref:Uncharacterized protein n=1 Tax=Discostella pseudostelligera TaxID=259834 RepID=A0ABD3N159_9STRA